MASLLHANLDSEDEEDDDYNPEGDKTAEKEDQTLPAPKRGSKRGRGPTTLEDEADEDEEEAAEEAVAEQEEEEEQDMPQTASMLAKRAKIEAVWQALNSRDMSGSNACRAPSSNTNLASLCGKSVSNDAPNPELSWQTQLRLVTPQIQYNQAVKKANVLPNSGDITDKRKSADPMESVVAGQAAPSHPCVPEGDPKPGPSRQQVSEDAKAAAALALTAAKEAASMGVSRSYNKVAVTETRRFAGQDIQVTVQVDKTSKQATQEGQKTKASGLDRFLAELEKKKKVNILDKSKMDWNQLKSSDTTMEEELESHKRSNKKYLDKVEFLKKAELREYEIERDKRLASDVRLRNRL